MKCPEVQSFVPDFLVGDLDASRHKEIEAHLGECSACREEIEGLSEIWARLGVLSDEGPSPALREGFYAMLERETQPASLAADRPEVSQIVLKLNRRTLLVAAAAMVLALGGFSLGSWVKGDGQAQGQARIDEVLSVRGQKADLAMLRSPAVGERLVGVSLLVQKGSRDPSIANALLGLLEKDPNVQVRLAAVESLYLFDRQPEVRTRLIEALEHQTSPLVQMALVDLLVALREKRANEALHRLIQDESIPPQVRERARSTLSTTAMKL